MNSESIEGGLYLANHRSICFSINVKEKGRFITFVDDIKLGRRDDIMNDNISISKGLQELERWSKQLR